MHRIPFPLAPAGFAAGLIFEAWVRARAALYAAAVLPQYRLPGPVLSIGNVTVGGTGKTPLVIHVSRMLFKLGFLPAILTRGYGRRRPNASWILAPEETVPAPAETLGDEPALMRRHLSSAWMGISKNRFHTGRSIASQEPGVVFLLDDGFQHRKLQRDLDIVILDRLQPFKTNRLLPRGTLREPLAALRRSHLIIVNGVTDLLVPDPLEAQIRAFHGQAKIFRCEQAVRSLVPFHLWEQDREPAAPIENPRSAYLVSAVGNPERYRRDIGRLGIEVRGVRAFGDHYRIRRKDWNHCVQEAGGKGVDAIITTEKDAVKISEPPDFPLLVAVQSTEISDEDMFEAALKQCIQERL